MLKTNKIIQAIGVVGRQVGNHRMNYMRVLKLLYIADRESLAETGRQISGDKVVAMDRGPVLSGVLDLINGQHVESQTWNRFISRDGYHIEVHTDPGVQELSQYEIEKLEEVAIRHRLDDEWVMVNKTHQFPEWASNHEPGSSRPIPLADILDAVGPRGDKAAMLKEAAAEDAFDRFFGV